MVRKFIGHYLFLTREQFFEETLGSVIIEAAASNMAVCVIILSLSLSLSLAFLLAYSTCYCSWTRNRSIAASCAHRFVETSASLQPSCTKS